MNNILKNALNFFKENNFKCETTNIDGQYKFYIDDDCYYYINDIYKINPIKYISNNDIDDILNISILEEIFNFLDKKLFLKINDILKNII